MSTSLSFYDPSTGKHCEYKDSKSLEINSALQDVVDTRQGILKEIYGGFGIEFSEDNPFNIMDQDDNTKKTNLTLLDNIMKYAVFSGQFNDIIGSFIGIGNISQWSQAVIDISSWYVANVHQYNQGMTIYCPLVSKMVRMDCSGFVTACLWRYGALSDQNWPLSSRLITSDSATAQRLQKAGFVKMTYTGPDILQPFDIMSYNGHVEIFAGKYGNSYKSYSWGRCHDIANGGLPCLSAHMRQGYDVIWRCSGGGILTDVNVDNSNLATYNGGVISLDKLMSIMPKGAKREIAGAVLEALDKYGPSIGLTEKGKVYMLAQMAHESANFRTMEEYASGKTYEGRLGNTQPGDGPRYKGRGPIQVTGRYNYTKINDIIKKFGFSKDIVADPYAVGKDYLLGAAVSMGWLMMPGNGPKAIKAANAGDVRSLTKAINGGYNGLQDRINLTNKILNSLS